MRSKVTLRLMVAGFLLATSPSLVAADRVIDTDHSTLKIHVGKAGLFSAAGHDHWVTAPFDGGNINNGDLPPVAFKVDGRKPTLGQEDQMGLCQQTRAQGTMHPKGCG